MFIKIKNDNIPYDHHSYKRKEIIKEDFVKNKITYTNLKVLVIFKYLNNI